MKLIFLIFFFRLNGAFGDALSVLEGAPVSFHTDIIDIQKVYLMWLYKSSIIAKLDGATREISLYDVDDGIFEDRLQMDNRTGSLTINDIRTKHSGLYQLKMITDQTLMKTFTLTVQDVFFAGLENKREGDSVTLKTALTDIKKLKTMLWMFGPLHPDIHVVDILINTSDVMYAFNETYRDRLHVNKDTGSLTIRDLQTTDTGVYQLQITNNKETIYKRFNVFVAEAEAGLSTGYNVLIAAVVLLFLFGVLGVIYYRYKYSHLKDELKTVYGLEGNSARLKTGLTEVQKDQKIVWRFGAKDPIIAQIQNTDDDDYNVLYGDDQRFRNKLQLDRQTGDLTIKDIRMKISGDYHLEITNRTKITRSKRFKVIVRVDTLKVTEGESVELQTGLSELRNHEKIQWRSEPKDVIIAEFNGKNIEYCHDERLKPRLDLNPQTGSLTIKNITNADSGGYELHIKSKNTSSYKKFNVLVLFHTLKHTAGDSVTLHTGVCELTEDDHILWTFGDKNTTIAEMNRATSHVTVYDGNDERFRDRLKLNEQNGDLTITNISRGHSDVYNLQITTGGDNKFTRFMLIAHEKLESVKEGDSLTLHPQDDADGTRIQRDDDDDVIMMLWMFGPEDNLIAKSDQTQKMVYDGADGRFKEKLHLNDQSGSLTITNINTTHAGHYKLHIIKKTHSNYRRFRVTVRATMEGDRTRDLMEEQSEGIPLIPVQGSHQN